MTDVGYHASHEQFRPQYLLECIKEAEQAGFRCAMCSDHFTPWSVRQGESGFAWSWLGAALEATTISLGVVTAPGQRYHPALTAQAAATLAAMYPGRFWVALGSGQAMNEHITGGGWPSKDERNARLEESFHVIRALIDGQTVNACGLIHVEDARLWTRPATPPAIFGSAITAETAGWVASWADGLITIGRPSDELKMVIDAFREGGGEGMPIYLQEQVSWADSENEALSEAHSQWRTNILDSAVLSELRHPEQFDLASSFVRPEDMRPHVKCSSDPGQHIEWLMNDFELGVERVLVHNCGRDQIGFIEAYGERVLPAVMETADATT